MVPGGVLLLDKPVGITSTRALATARRALAADKAGHTGTLDPFATGLLPLAFGEATKFSRFLIDSAKGYLATLSLGEESPTGDPESPVTRLTDDLPDLPKIAAVLQQFTGVQHQTPPMHSAVHVGGRRLYEYAREGIEVARESREIEILELRVVSYSGRALVLAVRCTKGTYVRVLAADIGKALGCGAYLSALRRTEVGDFRVEDAIGLEDLVALGAEKARGLLLPVEVLVAGLRPFAASAEQALHFSHGRELSAGGVGEAEMVAIFAPDRRFLGVAVAHGGERLVPLRLMAEASEIP